MKEIIREKLKHGKVAACGSDEDSAQYIAELSKIFPDLVHLTLVEAEVEHQPYIDYGVKTELFSDYKIDDETYIVITGDFNRVQKKMVTLNMKEYIDFASIHVVRAVIQNKELVSIMGNGAMAQLTGALKACGKFSEKYYIRYINAKQLYRGPVRIHKYTEYQHITKISDVYIYSTYSDMAYSRYIVDEDMLQENCKIVSVSANSFRGLHPQLTKWTTLNEYCFRPIEINKTPYTYFAFSIFDSVMKQIIESEMEKDEIVKYLYRPDLYTHADMDRTFNVSLKNIRQSDIKADIKLGDVLEQRKNDIVLNRSLEEWHSDIIEYILTRIFNIIGHVEPDYDHDHVVRAIDKWSGNEIPVLPCVLKHFNLYTSQKNKKYKIVTYDRIRYMNLKEYVEYYADHCINVRNMRKALYFKDKNMVTGILDCFEETVAMYGDKTAIVDQNGSTSYKKLHADACAIGTYLNKLYGETKRPVAVLMNRSAHSVAAFLGVVYSGNFYCPIDVKASEERMEKIMSVLKPVAVITDDDNRERAQKLNAPSVDFNTAAGEWVQWRRLNEIREKSIDTDPVYIIFSGETMGAPKGAVVSHRAMLDNMAWIKDTFDISDKDVIGNQEPFYSNNSTFDIYAGLKCGCTVHIIPDYLIASSRPLINYLNKNNITTICWDPSVLCRLANNKVLPVLKGETKLDKIFFCGDIMANAQLNIWRAYVPNAMYVNLYGMTEVLMNCLYYIVDRQFNNAEPLPVGRPCKNVEVILLDEDDNAPEFGNPGEICLRGNSLSYGYYNNPQQTARTFVQNPLNDKYEEIIYRTGDLGRYNENGELMYLGRRNAYEL